MTTPETYLGAGRALRFVNGSIARRHPGLHRLAPTTLPDDGLAYEGRWRIGDEDATAVAGARLDLDFGARRVFLVLGSRGGGRGRCGSCSTASRSPQRFAGTDVHDGVATIDAPAPLPPGRPAERRAPPPHARIRPRDLRLRLHLRMSLGAGTMEPMADADARRTVLVVDDEPTIGEIVSRYLERAGYATTTAADGLEAVRLADEQRPDLVVLDLMLPAARRPPGPAPPARAARTGRRR